MGPVAPPLACGAAGRWIAAISSLRSARSDPSDDRTRIPATMNFGGQSAPAWPTTVSMTNRKERRRRAVLAAVQDYGFADAALAAAERTAPDPAPIALVPVYAFEPEGGSEDALLNSATLWNRNLLVETLGVEADDDPTPVRLPGRDGSYVLFAAAAPG